MSKRAFYKDILDSLNFKHDEMVSQLHQLCRINSSSFNLEGLAAVAAELVTVFKPLGDSLALLPALPIQTIDMNGNIIEQFCGSNIFIRKRSELQERILLVGHMDTVYPADSDFQNLTYLSEKSLQGPGVADMKGGLLVILHALLAFEESPLAKNLGWDVLISADEEIGSPATAPLLAKLSTDYALALVYEPAMDSEGTLAKNRKGSGVLTIVASGKAAHAGRSFAEGRNAICYLAEVIIAIHALNNQRPGVTINIGKIAGGQAVNVVPDKAVVKLDIRISQHDDEAWVRSKLEGIFEHFKNQDYALSLSGKFARPVKPISKSTEKLFSRIQIQGELLDLKIAWKDSGGCCDGNNLAVSGMPVIDTLGVRDGNIHSNKEFILLDSLVERASLSTLLLLEIANLGLREFLL